MGQRKLAASQQFRRLARKLSAYTAAGASLCVLGPIGDVQAAIVYTDLGPGGQPIDNNYPNYRAYIDFQHDGEPEFTAFFNSNSMECGHNSNYGRTHREFGVRRTRSPNLIAQAGKPFPRGTPIHIDSAGISSAVLVFEFFSNCSGSGGTGSGGGPFQGLRGYVGLVFRDSDNSLHAGWADIAQVSSYSYKLFGYAYETEPGMSIRAGAVPEPPSLVLLAAGAAGLAALRRKRFIRPSA